MGGAWRQQQRAIEYLREGRPDIPRTLRRVWGYMRVYRTCLVFGIVSMIVGVAVGLVPPLLIRDLINIAIPRGDLHAVLFLGIGMFLFPVIAAVLSLAQNYLTALVAQGMIADLRDALYRHTQSLGIDFYTWMRAGEIQMRFLNDAASLQDTLTQSFLGVLANVVTVAGAFVVMVVIDWRLSIAAALALPAFAVPVVHFGQRRYVAVERAQRAIGRLAVVVEETLSLSGALVIKSFGTEAREYRRFQTVNDGVRAAQIEQTLVGQWSSVIVQALAALGPALIYTYGAYLVITQHVALGTIVAFATYLAQLYRPASLLANANATVVGGLALFDRIFQLLDVPQSVPAPRNPIVPPLTPTHGIELSQVSFHYPRGPAVLHDVSFTAPVGQLTALVGPSGAGKSTLLSLIARFYDPASGIIQLDGVDLKQISEDDLRQRIAIVTQEVYLFHTTLRANLCYGAPDATPAAIDAAVDAAQLRELVDGLPDGLETIVGERGYRLSGGEKQRVSIARAILREAPYLLLDEATSSLDSRAERQIQLALASLFQGRTVIAIAHRLSTIQRAEQIIVVNEGRVVERGTHESLLRQSGLYQRLYLAQFESVSPEQARVAD
jgi:ATP-binding cassette subfamily B protein